MRRLHLRVLGLAGLVILFSAASALADEPLHVRIDKILAQSHSELVAGLADDAEFLRRAFINLNGTIPSATDARQFLADPSPTKRSALIERLLQHPRYPLHMADVFDVMLMERRPATRIPDADWKNYLRESFAQNKPWNQLAREILSADGVDPKTRPAARFYLDREGEPNLLTREVGRIFFGRDLQCAQCHDHPIIADYHQSEYYGLYAFLNRSFIFTDEKAKLAYFAEKAEGVVKFESVFDKTQKDRTLPTLPGGPELVEPVFAPGDEYAVKPAKDVRPVPKYSRRAKLAEEATNGGNRMFARNIVNRLWAMMMGRGLVQPLDLHHPDNPPSHPELLEALADDFVAHNYDIKWFLTELALSEAYQRSVQMPDDLLKQAGAAQQQQKSVEEQQQQLASVVESSAAAAAKPRDDAHAARKLAYETAEELDKSDEAVTAAKKPVAEAEKALAVTRQAMAARLALAKSIADAVATTQNVVQQLPDVPELARAVQSLQAKSKEMTDQIADLTKACADQEAARTAVAAKLAETQAASAQTAAKLQTATKAVHDVTPAFLIAEQQERNSETMVNATKERLKSLESLSDFAKLATAAAESLAAVDKVKIELAAASQTAATGQAVPAKSAALEQRIVEARAKAASDQAAAEAAHRTLAENWSKQFAVRSLQPLSPEQFAWAVMQAIGLVDRQRIATEADLGAKNPLKDEEKNDAAKLAERAKQIDEATRAALAGNVAVFIELFGAGAGQPQQDFFATVDQALSLGNGEPIRSWLAPADGNLPARLLAENDPGRLCEELYLSVLTRRPTASETADVSTFLAGRANDRPAAIGDLIWALMASTEFRFNH